MAEISPDVLCQPDDTLGKDTAVQENQNNRTPVDNLALTSTNTDFAFSLYKELALNNPDKNVVFSPFSISTALAILSLGARNKTLEEILKGLKFSLTETPEAAIHQGFGHLLHMLSQPGDQVQIRTGSAMFIEKYLQILAEFKEKARALYQAEASMIDFQQPHKAKQLINDYVRKETQGKIKELISDLDEKTIMVLVNYIYFKGKWNRPFDPRNTFESEFYLDKKRSVKVPMMHHTFLTTPYFRDEDLNCSVVELKYTGNASALFILPDEGRMQQLEASLQPETLKKWKDSLSPRMIDDLYMPKFSISTDYSLENILPQLGIREVFSMLADLSGITGAKELRVSQVVHKALLDVAETGTEAAAATEIEEVYLSSRFKSITVRFNRPFLMFVSETNTQTTLFLAKISNPKKIDDLYMPKFYISTDYSLKKILPHLGINEVFSSQADLSGITEAKDLRVSQVVHKSVLNMAETGTEAAATTGWSPVGSALILNPPRVYFNRPFLMIVSDTNTQTPLFMAKVTNPKGN